MRPYFIALAALCFAGCASTTETVMQNDSGQKRFCYLHNDHTLLSVGAMTEYNRCMNDAGTAGFKQLK